MASDLTQDDLKRLLEYDKRTGIFRWLIPPRGSHIGAVAGSVNKVSGYVVIYIFGKNYTAHRLAWLYVHGVWPRNYIDHINECRSDNRLKNLRDVPNGTNLLNRSGKKIGIFYRKDRNTWYASIQIDGRSISLGTYPTENEALAARFAAKKVFEHFRN